MHSRPSIKDIARLADVSPSTVSRALSGSSRISEETRQRVQAIAEDLDYTPSIAARSLVTGASQFLGVIAPSLADPYVAAVMEGIEEACQRRAYRLLVANTGGDAGAEIEAVRMLWGQQPAGLIVLSSRARGAYQDLLASLHAPVVFVNNVRTGERVYSVANDNEHGGWLATQYLLEMGHTRIAYLGGPPAGRSHPARAAGYRRALAEASIPFEFSLMIEGDGSVAAGRAALAQILAQPPALRPTAVFCYNDLSALGLLAEAHQQGITIPDQLSVVGFDNVPYAELSQPALTTVEQPKAKMGRLAVETVVAANQDEPVADITLRGELILRHSATHPPTT